jgi:hypothetical protein
VIVSTYPESGSRNIGDQLITSCLKNLITDNIPGAEFNVIWRADSWDNVKDIVLAADHVFFACLAIRPYMHKREYPYLEELVDSCVPFSVIAAGTAFPVSRNVNIYEGFSEESIRLLKKVNEHAAVFTTRGVLSQEFCQRAGLHKAVFNGDVAFYDNNLDGFVFDKYVDVKKIVISDPHRPLSYTESMEVLVDGLKSAFPNAEVLIAQHGVSKVVEEFCQRKSIRIEKIYENRYSGLNVYDEADLHVGFRVHGHVSALKRRKYSYLLEQDGRGCDYGATIQSKISIPNYQSSGIPVFSIKNLIKFFIGRPLTFKNKASVSPAHQVLALIKRDAEGGFAKFSGLEKQIMEFNRLTKNSIKKVLTNAK